MATMVTKVWVALEDIEINVKERPLKDFFNHCITQLGGHEYWVDPAYQEDLFHLLKRAVRAGPTQKYSPEMTHVVPVATVSSGYVYSTSSSVDGQFEVGPGGFGPPKDLNVAFYDYHTSQGFSERYGVDISKYEQSVNRPAPALLRQEPRSKAPVPAQKLKFAPSAPRDPSKATRHVRLSDSDVSASPRDNTNLPSEPQELPSAGAKYEDENNQDWPAAVYQTQQNDIRSVMITETGVDGDDNAAKTWHLLCKKKKQENNDDSAIVLDDTVISEVDGISSDEIVFEDLRGDGLQNTTGVKSNVDLSQGHDSTYGTQSINEVDDRGNFSQSNDKSMPPASMQLRKKATPKPLASRRSTHSCQQSESSQFSQPAPPSTLGKRGRQSSTTADVAEPKGKRAKFEYCACANGDEPEGSLYEVSRARQHSSEDAKDE